MRTQTLAALAEPNRLSIVELLRDGLRSVGEIAVALEMRQPQASKHLRVLSDAGVLSAQAVARQRIYRLDEARFHEMREWLATFERTWDERLDVLGDLLERSRDSGGCRRGSRPATTRHARRPHDPAHPGSSSPADGPVTGLLLRGNRFRLDRA